MDQKTSDIINKWKNAYILTQLKECPPKGDVLLVGFRSTKTAGEIMKAAPASLTILEERDEQKANAEAWAKDYENVKIVSKMWTDDLSDLGKFDCVYFQHSFMETETVLLNTLFPQEVVNATKQAQVNLSDLKQAFSQVKVKFSDADIDDFYEKIGRHNHSSLEQFFNTLKENGNISDEQLSKALKKYGNAESAQSNSTGDIFADFIKAITAQLKDDGRVSCFMGCGPSRLDNSAFADAIAADPHLHYEEESHDVSVDDKKATALFMNLKKLK